MVCDATYDLSAVWRYGTFFERFHTGRTVVDLPPFARIVRMSSEVGRLVLEGDCEFALELLGPALEHYLRCTTTCAQPDDAALPQQWC